MIPKGIIIWRFYIVSSIVYKLYIESKYRNFDTKSILCALRLTIFHSLMLDSHFLLYLWSLLLPINVHMAR